MVEVIQKIKTAEENAEELRKTCRRTAAQMKEDATAQGKQDLERRTRKAAEDSADILGRADAAAAEYLAESHEKSQAICDEVTAAARANLDKAADFIVERIVGSL